VMSSVIVSRPKSARRARPARSMRILALMDEVYQREGERRKFSRTYPFKITVDHSLTVDIDQSPCDVFQLPKLFICQW